MEAWERLMDEASKESKNGNESVAKSLAREALMLKKKLQEEEKRK